MRAKIYYRTFIISYRKPLYKAAGAVTLGTAFVLIASGHNLGHLVTRAVDAVVVSPVRNYIYEPLREYLPQVGAGAAKIYWSISNFFEKTFRDKNLFEAIASGSQKLFRNVRGPFKFFFSEAIPLWMAGDYENLNRKMNFYWKPLKFVFYKPNIDRLSGSKARFYQVMDAMNRRDFDKHVSIMMDFYAKYDDLLDKISDHHLAEIINTFLDDSGLLTFKIQEMMRALEGEEDLRGKFDENLLMDFVRGENIQNLKNKMTAAKVAQFTQSVFSLFGVGASSGKEIRNNVESGVHGVLNFIIGTK